MFMPLRITNILPSDMSVSGLLVWYCLLCLSIRWIIKLQIQDSIIPIVISLRLALYVLYFSDGTKTYIYILCHSSTWTWHRQLESSLLKDQDLPISHSQSRGCWWPGDARSQDINSHDNDPIESRSLYPHTLGVKIAAIAILGFKHCVLYFAPCVDMSTYISNINLFKWYACTKYLYTNDKYKQ